MSEVKAWAKGCAAPRVTAAGQPCSPKTLEARDLCVMECDLISAGRARVAAAVEVAVDAALLALFVLSCASVLAGSYNPFIYFQF